jgi:hypothetical protein
MISISITEKLWDGVRPGSVKKTGLSEAIRDFIKANPKTAPGTPKAFDELGVAIKKLEDAIDKSEEAVKKAKDDKKGAAAKLKTWKDECSKGAEQLAKDRYQLGLLKASVEADGKLKEMAKTVEDAIKSGNQLLKDLTEGKLKDNKAAATQLQDLRSAMRDSLKATQKDGFVEFIRTYKEVMDWGIKPADVPMPPSAKAIKTRIPVLQEIAEKARVQTEKLLEESAKSRTGKAADLSKDLVSDYHDIAKTIKGYIATAKKYGADAHLLADKFKEALGKGTTYDKLLPIAQKMHEKILAFQETSLKEIARGRVSSGDVQAKRIKIRDSLKSTDPKAYQEFEAIASDEWNLVMVIFREVSEQVAEAHRQVERVLRLVAASSDTAKGPADTMAAKCDKAQKDLVGKFMK